MTSGDPFQLIQNSGVADTFSYTPAAGVYLCVTSVGGFGYTIDLVAETSPFVRNFIRFGEEASNNNNNAPLKKIFGNGIGVFVNSGNVNLYGIALSGIEL